MTDYEAFKQTLNQLHVEYDIREELFYWIIVVEWWERDFYFHNGNSQLYSHSEAHKRKPYS